MHGYKIQGLVRVQEQISHASSGSMSGRAAEEEAVALVEVSICEPADMVIGVVVVLYVWFPAVVLESWTSCMGDGEAFVHSSIS